MYVVLAVAEHGMIDTGGFAGGLACTITCVSETTVVPEGQPQSLLTRMQHLRPQNDIVPSIGNADAGGVAGAGGTGSPTWHHQMGPHVCKATASGALFVDAGLCVFDEQYSDSCP